jgi:lysophospholipase L1-like esterase
VNGQVCVSKKDGNRQCESDSKSYSQSLLWESRKLIVNKQKFSNCSKHKVLLIGDSQLCGCAAYMKAFLNDQFEVLGYVKPGASSKSMMDSVKSDIGKLTMDDLLIVCSGSNDAERSDFRKVFHDVISFVKSVKHTNVILISIPYRYNLLSSAIHNEFKNVNRKLCKLAKFFFPM